MQVRPRKRGKAPRIAPRTLPAAMASRKNQSGGKTRPSLKAGLAPSMPGVRAPGPARSGQSSGTASEALRILSSGTVRLSPTRSIERIAVTWTKPPGWTGHSPITRIPGSD